MRKSWKVPVIIICIVVVGVVCYFGYNFFTKPANTTAQNYMKVKATKGTLAVTVTASGTAASGVSKDIIAQNNGTMGSFSVKPGDNVKSGQSIGNIVDQSSIQGVQKAQNTLAQDNLKLAQLKKSLNTLYVKAPVSGIIQSVNASIGDDSALVAKVLHAVVMTYTGGGGKQVSLNVDAQSGIISNIYVSAGTAVTKGDNLFKLSSEDINNSIASQNINIQQDQAALSNAQTQAGYNNITSPIDGTVAALDFNPGDTIQPGKTIATIIDLTQMQTVVAVDELDIDKVAVGQKTAVTLDAIPGKSFTGQVLKISSIGKTTNAVTTYDVTVSIGNATGVKTGMTTNVNISVQSKDNVIMLPIEAVQGSGSSRFVTVETAGSTSNTANTTNNQVNTTKRSNTGYSGSGSQSSRSGSGFTTSISSSGVTRKKVEVGISNQNYIEVTSGVNEGDTVLVQIIKSTTSTTNKSSNPLGGTGSFGGGTGGYGGGTRGGQ
jgi:HlyD family secretion protein